MSKLASQANATSAASPLNTTQLDALLSFHGFNLNETDKTAVLTHMQIISTHAINVLSFPLAESYESAPIYRP